MGLICVAITCRRRRCRSRAVRVNDRGPCTRVMMARARFPCSKGVVVPGVLAMDFTLILRTLNDFFKHLNYRAVKKLIGNIQEETSDQPNDYVDLLLPTALFNR